MNHSIRLIFLSLLALLGACASTQVEESWTLPGYAPPPAEQRKVLVVTLASTETIRKAFELAFVKELEENGILAVPSLQWMPDSTQVNRDSLRPIVAQNGITSVLVNSLRGIETSKTYQPAEQIGPGDNLYRNFDTYMVYSSSGQHETGSYAEMTEYLLETNLFDARNEKLSWSVRTRTTDPTSLEAGVRSVVSKVIQQAENDNVF
ncbi:MAG: hypothetical protein CMK83_15585 [Pseudomonadales bacterium]|jgi:hypothetical protein|uniref:hypothetical protein n=1 Tax=unclassified Ketobacter TaxID=2639109 RepID=UPI000C4AE015|nr:MULTISPECIES: hypothetical protein [unclassified Ketobacter]MAA60359.1 hypothetical protein [Pseudomonadales bacterium]MEC8809740.1 hypothetical protein [Pseudomonadota bacterium]TNC90635.1 MAG: hypothetical protein CSH49_02060 [Alcanivorax sp.]HAG96126.1 hypothetical protein [Gammaproteobacteria bacterium]MAQ25627.1 hypothetical protein [Pseudomonadales bacterium]|tara:strand:- start:34456 stop:35073 length:618 start_codon:yes stop_codon:yes gene_type:complete